MEKFFNIITLEKAKSLYLDGCEVFILWDDCSESLICEEDRFKEGYIYGIEKQEEIRGIK